MNKPSSLIWMVFILLLIVPTPAGKFIIDLAGGIFLILTIIPLLLGGVGWFAWKRIQSKVEICEACGSSFLPTRERLFYKEFCPYRCSCKACFTSRQILRC